MKKYLIRFAKYVVYFMVLLTVFTSLMEYTKPEPFKDFTLELFRMYLLIGIGFSAIYPLIGFGKREIHLNHTFADDREQIEKIMDAIGLFKESEEGSVIVYRYKNKVKKFFLLYEDVIVIETSNNPIVVSGPLKEIRRMKLMFEQYLQDSAE